MLLLSNIDIIIVLVYFIACLYLGLRNYRRVKTLKQYALGFKNASTSLLVCTFFATAVGAGSTIGAVEKVYLIGSAFVLKQLVQPIFWLITAKIFANNIERFRGCLTIGDIMFKLYGKAGRYVSSIASIIIGIGVIAAQAHAAGQVFHYFFGVSQLTGILISYGILTVYSALGGVRSVVTTEIFQFLIFFFIFPISYVLTLKDLGGFDQLIALLPSTHTSINFESANLWYIASLVLYAFLPNCDSTMVQRFLMAENSKELKHSLKITALISIPFSISLCLVAFIIKAIAPEIASADALLYYTANLPMGIKGLMVTGLIAIIMSTAEAWINSTSIIIVNDIINNIFPMIKSIVQIRLLRVISVGTAFLSVFIALSNYPILEIIWFLNSLWYPLVLTTLSAGFLGFKTNNASFVSSSVFSMLFVIISALIGDNSSMFNIAYGLIGSAIGFFGMHYYQIKTGLLKNQVNQYSLVSYKAKFKSICKYFVEEVKLIPASVTEMQNIPYTFASLTMVHYFIYIFSIAALPAHNILVILIVIGFALCSLLLLKDLILTKTFLKKYLQILCTLSITFCQPFVASYIVFSGQCECFWAVNFGFTIAAVFFYLNTTTAIAVVASGIAGGYILSMATQDYVGVHTVLNYNNIDNVVVYILFALASLKFIRDKEKINVEKIAMMQTMGGAIAHEVRTPLAVMKMCSETMNGVLSEAFANAKQEGNNYHLSFTAMDYEALNDMNNTIYKVGEKSNHMIDSILLSMKTSVIASDKKTLNIKDVVEEAIQEYSTFDSSVLNVKLKFTSNFKVKASLHYLKHVILNLLKNAYRYGGKNVEITIETKANRLIFTDFGVGISEEVLPRIFDRFFSKSEAGTGLGLAFCKMVMDDLNGNISCKSKLGIYTEFKLSFKKLK